MPKLVEREREVAALLALTASGRRVAGALAHTGDAA